MVEEALYSDDLELSAGVEPEAEETPKPGNFRPEDIEITSRRITIDLLMTRLEEGALDLQPDFQRLYIWDDVRASRLIESIILRIPISTFYLYEEKEENWIVVDGVQRLTTIARFVRPNLVEGAQLTLTELDYLSDFNGKSFEQLGGQYQRRIRETELDLNIIRQRTPKEVMYNIFTRINTGGIPLSAQELRHATIPGKARYLLRDWADSEIFKNATDRSIKPRRMDDRDMVLRFIAFRIANYTYTYSGTFDGFLREAMKQINSMEQSELDDLWRVFKESLQTAHEIFGKHAFRKLGEGRRRYLINKALFEAVTVSLAKLKPGERAKLMKRKELVVQRLRETMDQNKFKSAISRSYSSKKQWIAYRFETMECLFREVLQC